MITDKTTGRSKGYGFVGLPFRETCPRPFFLLFLPFLEDGALSSLPLSAVCSRKERSRLFSLHFDVSLSVDTFF